MSFRRRRVVAGHKRQVQWGGAYFLGSEVQFIPVGPNEPSDVVNFWFRWPTGNPDPLNNDDTPPECTLIKTMSAPVIRTDNTSTQANDQIIIFAGLISWDAIEPLDFGVTAGVFPNPADASFDWIWRTTFLLQQQNTVISASTGGTESTYISKAMRKLPPGTGVVGLLSMVNFSGVTLRVSWSWDVRYAVKAL